MRSCIHPVAVLLSTLQLSKCHRKQVLPVSLSPFRDRYRTPETDSLLIEEHLALGSSFLRRNLLGGLLTRSCLPVVFGDIGIMPQYLCPVKSFWQDFYKFIKLGNFNFSNSPDTTSALASNHPCRTDNNTLTAELTAISYYCCLKRSSIFSMASCCIEGST